MKENIKHIRIEDKEYPLVFNLNVMEKIQEEYETLENWGDLTEGKQKEIDIKALKYGVTEMINEGIDMENENRDVKVEFLTQKQVGRIITEIGYQKMAQDVQETVISSTDIGETSKNV